MIAKMLSPQIVQVYNAISNLYVFLYSHYASCFKKKKQDDYQDWMSSLFGNY